MRASDLILTIVGFLGLLLVMMIMYKDPIPLPSSNQPLCPKVIVRNSEPLKVAVVRFADASGAYGRFLNMFGWDVKESMQVMVETALQLQRDFRVYARERLINLVIEEQRFENLEGYVDPSTAVRIGKLTGLQYLVTGMISDFVIRTMPTPLAQATAAAFTVDFRVIDTTTGEIVLANAASGIAIGGEVGGGIDLGTIQRAARAVANEVIKKIATCVAMGY